MSIGVHVAAAEIVGVECLCRDQGHGVDVAVGCAAKGWGGRMRWRGRHFGGWGWGEEEGVGREEEGRKEVLWENKGWEKSRGRDGTGWDGMFRV